MPDQKRWYVVKVQSGREESIKNAIERRVKIEGLQEYFGEIVIPTEKYTDMVRNKRVVKERKLFPGYLMVNVEYNDRILYLFRETSGVGDFVGAGLNKAPQPMKPTEVASMQAKIGGGHQAVVETAKPKFDKGDRVKVKDGPFAGMEGEVKELIEARISFASRSRFLAGRCRWSWSIGRWMRCKIHDCGELQGAGPEALVHPQGPE